MTFTYEKKIMSNLRNERKHELHTSSVYLYLTINDNSFIHFNLNIYFQVIFNDTRVDQNVLL